MTNAALRRWLWVAAAAALALRLLLLGQNGLWHDEVATWNTAVLPLGQIRAVAASHSNSPPLYFWATHFMLAGLGQTEWALRFLSVLAGALTIPVIGLLVAELAESDHAGAAAGGLLALSPLHLWYSQEARSYALLTLFCALALLYAARAIRSGARTAWLASAGFLLAAMLTHPVAGAMLPVLWCWVWWGEQRDRSLRPLLLISLVLVLTAGLVALSIPAHEHPPEHHVPPLTDLGYALYAYLVGYSFGPGIRELQDSGIGLALERHWLEAGLGVAAVAALGIATLRRQFPGRRQFAALALLPPLQIVVAALFSVFPFNVRYALPGVLGMIGLASALASSMPRAAGRAAVGLLLILFLWSDIQWFTVPQYWKDDTRGAVAWLSARLPEGAIVGVEPGYMIETMEYYASRARPSLRVSRVAPDTAGAPMDSLSALALTRFHHVPEWAAIEESFTHRRMPTDSTAAILGYHILLARP